MKTADHRIAVYYAMPLCNTCNREVSMIRQVAYQEKAALQVKFSLWKRIKHGLRFMSMPVVVVDGRAFSVLGAFGEKSLTAQLRACEDNGAKTKELVKEGYARIANKGGSCCAPAKSGCGCGDLPATISKRIGYTDQDLAAVPDGANLGLGCGNPVALASLKEGESVLDLGSGAGIDCFIAAAKVGPTGKVIGVDMTPEMVERARKNAKKAGHENVEFRLGDIDSIPVEDSSVDAVLSNCVINLAPDKKKVFGEAYRVLKPGGRMMVSDIVILRELPAAVKGSIEAYVGCVAGAIRKDAYLAAMADAGFHDISIIGETPFAVDLLEHGPTIKTVIRKLHLTAENIKEAAESVVSIKVAARKR